MNDSFSYITSLEYRLKAAQAEVAAFKSGKKYQDMVEVRRKDVKALEQKVKRLEKGLTQTYRDMVAAREHWFEAAQDAEKEHRREVTLLEKSSDRWKHGR